MDNWFQPFTIYSGASKQDGPSSLTLTGPLGQVIELKAGVDYEVMGTSGTAQVEAPVVFAGYGITAPDIKNDDYKGVDVEAKVVVVRRHTPRWTNEFAPFDGGRKQQHADLIRRQALAEANGAAAVIVVNSASEGAKGDPLAPFGYLRGGGARP